MATTDPIRRKDDINAICNFYLNKRQYRNYVLIIIGIYTFLRISDLLRLRVRDFYITETKKFRNHLLIIEKKTKKERVILINKEVIKALKLYFETFDCIDSEMFIFQNNRKGNLSICREQAYKIMKDAVYSLGIDGRISPHSLRKTKPYHLLKKKNATPEILLLIMEAFGHTDIRVTMRYFGLTQDALDHLYSIRI